MAPGAPCQLGPQGAGAEDRHPPIAPPSAIISPTTSPHKMRSFIAASLPPRAIQCRPALLQRHHVCDSQTTHRAAPAHRRAQQVVADSRSNPADTAALPYCNQNFITIWNLSQVGRAGEMSRAASAGYEPAERSEDSAPSWRRNSRSASVSRAFGRRSGRRSQVRRKASRRRQRSTSAWCPESRTSGTR